MCTQFVYAVKYYSIGDLYTKKLDLFYIWRLYPQIWISGTNKGKNMNMTLSQMNFISTAEHTVTPF
jgi:hypothetical protein